MLRISLFFFLSVLFLNSGISQSTSSGTIPIKMERKFKRDATRLALRLAGEKEDLRYLDINIPTEANVLFTALSDIYKTSELAEFLGNNNVHTFPNPSIDRIGLIFDDSIDWAMPLYEGLIEIDSEELNALLDDYDLFIDKHEKWNATQDIIIIRSKAPLNMAAIANEFYTIDGIMEIDFGIPTVSGNDIKVSQTDFPYLTFQNRIRLWKISQLT